MKAVVCDLLGKVEAANADADSLTIDVDDTKRMVVYLQVRDTPKAPWRPGHIGADARVALGPKVLAGVKEVVKQAAK